MRYVDEQAVADVLRMEELIPLMRQAMIDFSRGNIAQPIRRIIEDQPHGGFFGSMPAASANALGAKLVTFYPGNAAKNLHTHMAVIVLFKPETGEPMLMMDGRLITEMRTSAVTATFVDAVAAPAVRQGFLLRRRGKGCGGGCDGYVHHGARSGWNMAQPGRESGERRLGRS